MGLRFGVPVAAFQWLADELIPKKADADVKISSAPPGIRMAGNFDMQGTRVRGDAQVFVDRIVATHDRMRIEVRLEDIKLKVLDDKKTQISALIRSGALSLANPGALISEMPDMPDFIVDATDNRIAIDLMKHPSLSKNVMVRRVLGLMTGFFTVARVETDDTHFDVAFRVLPDGLGGAADALDENVLTPAARGVRNLLGGGGRRRENEVSGSRRGMLLRGR